MRRIQITLESRSASSRKLIIIFAAYECAAGVSECTTVVGLCVRARKHVNERFGAQIIYNFHLACPKNHMLTRTTKSVPLNHFPIISRCRELVLIEVQYG